MHLGYESRFILILLTCVVLAGGLFAWRQRQGQFAFRSATVALESGLLDGIYSVLLESETFGVADDVSPPHKTLAYDGRHIGEIRPVTYLAIGLRPYVPLVFERPPTMAFADNGFASLHLTLESEHARFFTANWSTSLPVTDASERSIKPLAATYPRQARYAASVKLRSVLRTMNPTQVWWGFRYTHIFRTVGLAPADG